MMWMKLLAKRSLRKPTGLPQQVLMSDVQFKKSEYACALLLTWPPWLDKSAVAEEAVVEEEALLCPSLLSWFLPDAANRDDESFVSQSGNFRSSWVPAGPRCARIT